jgi:hypothetical protein
MSEGESEEDVKGWWTDGWKMGHGSNFLLRGTGTVWRNIMGAGSEGLLRGPYPLLAIEVVFFDCRVLYLANT